MRKLTMTFIAASVAISGCAMNFDQAFFFNRTRAVWPEALVDQSFQRTVITVRQSDGTVSRGIRLFSPNATANVLFFQGNGETVDGEGAQRLWHFQRLNVNAIMLDRRGYGQTPGEPTMDVITSDALAAFDQIRSETKGLLIVHGFSLGSVLASRIAQVRAVDALILEGTLSDFDDFAEVRLVQNKVRFHYPKISPELQAIKTKSALATYAGPLWIVAGEKDKDTPPELAKRLFAALQSGHKELTVISGADHDALNSPLGQAAYQNYLNRLLAPSTK